MTLLLVLLLLVILLPDTLIWWFGFGVLLGLAHLVVPVLGPIVLLAAVIVVTLLVSSIHYTWKQRQEAAMREAAQRAFEAWQRGDAVEGPY